MNNVYKDYIVLVKDNEVILDLALKDNKQPTIIKGGYRLVQSDDPMCVFIGENGKVYLHE